MFQSYFKKIIMIGLLLTSSAAWAQSAGGGNGGSGTTAQFEFNVEQIRGWITRNQFAQIDLSDVNLAVAPSALSAEMIKTADEILQHRVQLNFDDTVILIGSKPRTCENFASAKLIHCNTIRWSSEESPESRYFLVLHELLSIAGFEKNDGYASEYKIGRKLLPFISPTKVYLLQDTASTQSARSTNPCRIYFNDLFDMRGVWLQVQNIDCVVVSDRKMATYTVDFTARSGSGCSTGLSRFDIWLDDRFYHGYESVEVRYNEEHAIYSKVRWPKIMNEQHVGEALEAIRRDRDKKLSVQP